MQEIYDDGLPQLQQIAKTEEELQSFSTAEDMNELERSLFLLRKGYMVQKSSVVYNLPRLCKEPDANEKLLPLIINQMTIWDIGMQSDCLYAFQNAEVIENLSQLNCEMLLMQILEIFGSTDLIQYERFIQEWMEVLDLILPKLGINFINLTVIPHMKQLTTYKSDLQSRLAGFKIMIKIVLALGLEAFDSDLCYKRLVQQMSFDRSWRIRKQFADFISKFLEPLDEYRQHFETKQRIKQGVIKVESKTPTDNPISKRAKQIKKTFKSILQDGILEILSDDDDQVAIEGISILTEFFYLFKKSNFEQKMIPRLEHLLKNAIENRISVSQQARLSRLQGPILHRLDYLGLLKDNSIIVDLQFHFFCICLKEQVFQPTDPSILQQQASNDIDDGIGMSIKEYYHNKQLGSHSVLLSAVYNLPCFYKIFGNLVQTKSSFHGSGTTAADPTSLEQKKHSDQQPSSPSKAVHNNSLRTSSYMRDNNSEEKKQQNASAADLSMTQASRDAESQHSVKTIIIYSKEIEKMVLQLSQEDKPTEVRRTLAASYHEMLAYKKDVISLRRLDKLLDNFLQDPYLKESGVQTMLTKNLVHIVKNYFAGLNVQDIVLRIHQQRATQKENNTDVVSLDLKTAELDDQQQTKQKIVSKSKSFIDKDSPNNLSNSQNNSSNPNEKPLQNSLIRTSSHKEILFSGNTTTEQDLMKEGDFVAEKLFSFIPKECFPLNQQHEIAYSQLLGHLVLLFDKIIISQGGSRRDCEAYLRNMAQVMHFFNIVELQDLFIEKLDALIMFSCDMVRGAVFYFLSHLISLQYRKELRFSLIQKIKENAYLGATIQQRKNFITFCTESVRVNTLERDGIFEKFFYPFLLKLGHNECNYTVQMHLIKSLTKIRYALIEYGDGNSLLKLNKMISELKQQSNLHPEVFKKLFVVCCQFNSDSDMERIAEMGNVNLDAKIRQGNKHMRQLDQRDEFEQKARQQLLLKENLRLKTQPPATRNHQSQYVLAASPNQNNTMLLKQDSGNSKQELVPTQLTNDSEDQSQQLLLQLSGEKPSPISKEKDQQLISNGLQKLLTSPDQKTKNQQPFSSILTKENPKQTESSCKSARQGVSFRFQSLKQLERPPSAGPHHQSNSIMSPMRKRHLKVASTAISNNVINIPPPDSNSITKEIIKKLAITNDLEIPPEEPTQQQPQVPIAQGSTTTENQNNFFVERADLKNFLQKQEKDFDPKEYTINTICQVKNVEKRRKVNQQQHQKSQPSIVESATFQQVLDENNKREGENNNRKTVKLTSPRVYLKQHPLANNERLVKLANSSTSLQSQNATKLNKDLKYLGIAPIENFSSGAVIYPKTNKNQPQKRIVDKIVFSSPPLSPNDSKRNPVNSIQPQQQVIIARSNITINSPSTISNTKQNQQLKSTKASLSLSNHNNKVVTKGSSSGVMNNAMSSVTLKKKVTNLQHKQSQNFTDPKSDIETKDPSRRFKAIQKNLSSVQQPNQHRKGSSSAVLFDHFISNNGGDPQIQVQAPGSSYQKGIGLSVTTMLMPSLPKDEKRKQAVSNKLKGIIMQKKNSASTTQHNLFVTNNSTNTRKGSSTVKKSLLVKKRSGRLPSSCNSSPTRGQKMEPILAANTVNMIQRPCTPKRQTTRFNRGNNSSSDLIDFQPLDSHIFAAKAREHATTPNTPSRALQELQKKQQLLQNSHQQSSPDRIMIFSTPRNKQKNHTNYSSKVSRLLNLNNEISQTISDQGDPSNNATIVSTAALKHSIYEPDEEPCDPPPFGSNHLMQKQPLVVEAIEADDDDDQTPQQIRDSMLPGRSNQPLSLAIQNKSFSIEQDSENIICLLTPPQALLSPNSSRPDKEANAKVKFYTSTANNKSSYLAASVATVSDTTQTQQQHPQSQRQGGNKRRATLQKLNSENCLLNGNFATVQNNFVQKPRVPQQQQQISGHIKAKLKSNVKSSRSNTSTSSSQILGLFATTKVGQQERKSSRYQHLQHHRQKSLNLAIVNNPLNSNHHSSSSQKIIQAPVESRFVKKQRSSITQQNYFTAQATQKQQSQQNKVQTVVPESGSTTKKHQLTSSSARSRQPSLSFIQRQSTFIPQTAVAKQVSHRGEKQFL